MLKFKICSSRSKQYNGNKFSLEKAGARCSKSGAAFAAYISGCGGQRAHNRELVELPRPINEVNQISQKGAK